MLKQKRIPKKIRGALLCWTRFTTKWRSIRMEIGGIKKWSDTA
jgi:hypothetical protein